MQEAAKLPRALSVSDSKLLNSNKRNVLLFREHGSRALKDQQIASLIRSMSYRVGWRAELIRAGALKFGQVRHARRPLKERRAIAFEGAGGVHSSKTAQV
jgi:hypothetical protein